MPRIPKAEIERIKKETDLVALVRSAGVELKPQGKDLVGLCPFHEDKTPSLLVSPEKNLWNCLGACGTGGGPVDWVIKTKGTDFKGAVKILRSEKNRKPTDKAVSGTSNPKALPPEEDEERQALLKRVTDYYHASLKRSPSALKYLEKRGLVHPDLIERFKLGFADRSLSSKLPAHGLKAGKEIRARLAELGIYKENGRERFHGSIVVPIFDEAGLTAEIYARKIAPAGKLRKGTPFHSYLPGPHRGFWNLDCLKHKTVILCESLIDAMSFWVHGFENVTAAFGTNGFTEEYRHLILSSHIERLYIAFDADAAGDKSAEKLAKNLSGEGIACFRVGFPIGCDANDFILGKKANDRKEALTGLIEKAVALTDGVKPVPSLLAESILTKGKSVPSTPLPVEPVLNQGKSVPSTPTLPAEPVLNKGKSVPSTPSLLAEPVLNKGKSVPSTPTLPAEPVLNKGKSVPSTPTLPAEPVPSKGKYEISGTGSKNSSLSPLAAGEERLSETELERIEGKTNQTTSPRSVDPQLPLITPDKVVDYYHKKLYDNRKSLDFLKQRRLNEPELYARFKIGFADGSLGKMLDSDQKASLVPSGLFISNQREYFYHCLTFSLSDEHERTTGCCGLYAGPDGTVEHVYPGGEHQGIFNRKASRIFDWIILTSSVVDALSLIVLGIENVQTLNDAHRLTNAHFDILKRDRVKHIVLALDNDKESGKAAERLRLRLEIEDIKVSAVFPKLKDWNEELVRAESLEMIRNRVKSLFEDPETEHRASESDRWFDSITEDSLGTVFAVRGMAYKVGGVKELFVSSLKVGIKSYRINEKGKETDSWFDSPDLYAAQSRSRYSRSVGPIYRLEPKQVEKDLIKILEYFENKRDRELLNQSRQKNKAILSPEERELGMAFLTDPKLFQIVSEDLDTLGYTGEELNKQLLYLAASSRLMDDPISVIIQSQSASGKSKMVDTIAALMPDEEVVSITSLSDQALNYAGDLMHKFLSLGEAVHSEVVEHQIREMLSAKRLSRLVTLKDDKTGKMVSKAMVVPVVVSAVITATGYKINPENASRSFLINIDESKEQTRRIHRKQRGKYSSVRYYEKRDKIPAVVKKHKAAQRLLVKRTIFNRFADLIDFPDALVRTRRDNERFIDLISSVCFLRQYQKPIRNDGKIDYIECDLDDYANAWKIMIQGTLCAGLEEIPQGTRKLYEELTELVAKKANDKKLGIGEIGFTQRDVREFTGYTQSWISRHLRILVAYEYVLVVGGGFRRSKGFYRLIADDQMERLDLSMIPSPEEMKQMLKKGG